MKICRFSDDTTDDVRVGLGLVLDSDDKSASVSDLRELSDDSPDVGELLASGVDLAGLASLAERSPTVRIDRAQLRAPIVRPPEFLAIGLNYRAHVAEGGRPDPTSPVVFNKQATCVNGPHQPVHIPADAPDLVDYEGELGVVIGKVCRHVPVERAREVVAGYLIVNDVSVRDWQMASPTMTMGKSWDTHGPIGPWFVTDDEIDDPMNLELRTIVGDDVLQQTNTGNMIFDIWTLIAYLSTAFTLLPGTIIATGTPEGVGVFRDPRRMLAAGERVRVEIDGIGAIDNPVITEPDPVCRIG
ncbi:MAG: fumarylacetoacetate hydrolase family protein [Actinomycetia bacterium]|nr:fumarylacetoacetate hydrolase family protein [Actinomycetes bacterium]MCP4961504.1 fumarylacetoacetate hydrolase family protein [Actinomycetes bacterium]